MATITHTKVSAIADGADTSLVRPSDWNATHTIVGLDTDINAAITAHEALSDPHPAYLKQAEADALYSVLAHVHTGVYEPADASILKDADIGVTVASFAHNHTGVYEPADATILKDADIGVTVAAQSHAASTANPHGVTAAQVGADATGTASTAITNHEAAADPHATAGYLQQADTDALYKLLLPVATSVSYTAGGTTTITLSQNTDVYYATAATGATTWAFSGPAASGKVTSFTLKLTNGGSQTQTWPTSVDWAGGTAPTLTAAGVDILTFFTHDNGTIWYGFLAAADIK